MVKCSRVLPQTSSCLLPLALPRFESLPGACEKVASDLGLGSGFCWVLQFPLSLTT